MSQSRFLMVLLGATTLATTACAGTDSPVAPTASTAATTATVAAPSGVRGTVTVAPGCPGPQVMGRPCVAPLANRAIELRDAAGAVVASSVTAANGAYELRAPAGNFIVQVVRQGVYPRCDPKPVTLTSATMSQLDMVCDSGMR